jgi:Family of unknown function (DUF5989)/Saxitoxin biosynthesis operon protein SxtJ
MRLLVPYGFNALNSTEANPVLTRSRYLRRLDERRETDEIRQLTNFGLTIGWLFTLLGGFCWFCVISQFDWFWRMMMIKGLMMLCLGTVLPQLLYWPHRLWMGLAHLQGRLVMTILLTVVYFGLISPLGWLERRRRSGSHPFHSWDETPPTLATGWEALKETPADRIAYDAQRKGSRSLISLFAETMVFFAERGHYLLLPVLLFLLLLGLILFFVQTSALAPFIYTIG